MGDYVYVLVLYKWMLVLINFRVIIYFVCVYCRLFSFRFVEVFFKVEFFNIKLDFVK